MSELPKSLINLSDQMQAWFPEAVLNDLKEAGRLACEQGISLFLIGGNIRDMLLHRPFDNDVDLVSESLELISFVKALHRTWGGECLTYPQYGTATLRRTPLEFDFATARTEVYASPGANPQVRFSPLKADLFRRDFTVNAMAVNLWPDQWGDLIDPFAGFQDLQKRELRTWTQSKFSEDPVRIWRLARLSQTLHFDIDPVTCEWAHQAMENQQFDGFLTARIRRELQKILKSAKPTQLLPGFNQLELWRCLSANFDFKHFKSLCERLEHVLPLFPEVDSESCFVMACLSCMPQVDLARQIPLFELTKQQMRQWQQIQDLNHLSDWGSIKASVAYERLQICTSEVICFLSASKDDSALAGILQAYWTQWRLIKPVVSGTMLKEWMPAGPGIRQVLQKLKHAYLDQEIQTAEQELAMVQELIKNREYENL